MICVKCISAAAARQGTFAETFTFTFHDPESSCTWDADQARAIITSKPRRPVEVPQAWLGQWLSKKETFVPEHVDHIPRRSVMRRALSCVSHTSSGLVTRSSGCQF